jgi:hypothetical protein
MKDSTWNGDVGPGEEGQIFRGGRRMSVEKEESERGADDTSRAQPGAEGREMR